ncbi:hypothetical protein [Polluticaenibacter yanchengensis]|uniref:Pentapeptide repeat-containing protein n=1 Tax=Polluticaenibacter yanchengensis TaxID=3014562 RepID=A0ABT4UIS4_9BACT|nr:hypothetical protein [Chitinophagaceae bacterium LY-5]
MENDNQILPIANLRQLLNLISPKKEPLIIKGKIFNYNIPINNTNFQSIDREFIFDSCVFNDRIDVVDDGMKNRYIFKDCTFSKRGTINLHNYSFEGKCRFLDNITLVIKEQGLYSFLEHEVKSLITVNGCISEVYFNIGDLNSYDKNNKINDEKSYGGFYFIGIFSEIIVAKSRLIQINFDPNCLIKNTICLTDSHINEFYAPRLDTHAKCDIYLSYIGKCDIYKNTVTQFRLIDIEESLIDYFKLMCDDPDVVKILKSTINNIDFYGNILSKNKIFILSSTVKNISFNSILNIGIISLNNVIMESGLFKIDNCNLGKIDFINCNFSEIKMIFLNSKISEAFLSLSSFPKVVFNENGIDYLQTRLMHGQLATASLKQGDNVSHLDFSSNELYAHYKTLKWFSSKIFQKFNLWLNYISNDFGRNWVQSTGFSIAIGFIFFLLLLTSIENYKLRYLDFKLLPALIKFLNPIRVYELDAIFNNTPIAGLKLNPRSYVIDFLGRIFLTYGYYQTIQAFRRFGRK